MTKSSRYPTYDVWEQREAWDNHTMQVVGKRKTAKVAYQFFTREEADLLYAVVEVIVDDIRMEIISFITAHLDEVVASPIGESQRKKGVPEKKQLYRTGLTTVDETCLSMYAKNFLFAEKQDKEAVLRKMEQSHKDIFKKMTSDIVSAYYSHPAIWSDIGYGGPAYPRGYVRVEKGLVDPWEAKQDGE